MMENVIQTDTYRSDFFKINSDILIFDRQSHVLSDHFETDVFPNYWSVAFANLDSKKVFINSNQAEHLLPSSSIVVIPPHSTLTWQLAKGDYAWSAYMVDGVYPSQLPKTLAYAKYQNLNDFKNINNKKKLIETIKSAKWIECTPALSKKIKVIHDKIHREFKLDTSFDDYAKEVNVSLSYLSRQFSKELHISPLQFRNKLRCMQVLADLLFKGARVAESCFDNGFQDVSHFNKVFKKIFKVTPSEFLKLKP